MTAAIELNPEYAAAYEKRGIAYRRIKADGPALADFETASALKPNKAWDAYFNRGNLFAAQHRYEMAIKDYTKVLTIMPEHMTFCSLRE